MKTGYCAAVVGFLTLVLITRVSSVVVHHVGGSAAWTNFDVATLAVPDYTDWSARTYVHVGDSLVFSYAPTYHDVVSMPSLDAYENCDFKYAIVLDNGSSGSFSWTATAPGTYYFSCDKSVEGLGTHCGAGQKVAITVRAYANSAHSPSQGPRPVNSPSSNPPIGLSPYSSPQAGSETRSPLTSPATPTPPPLSPEQSVSEIPPTESPSTVLTPAFSPEVSPPGQHLSSPKLSPEAAPHAFTPLVSPVAAPGKAPRMGSAPAFSPPAPSPVPASVASPPTPLPVARGGTPGQAPSIPPFISEIPTGDTPQPAGTPRATQAPTEAPPAPDLPTTVSPAESPEQSVGQPPVNEKPESNRAAGHFERKSWIILLVPAVLVIASLY